MKQLNRFFFNANLIIELHQSLDIHLHVDLYFQLFIQFFGLKKSHNINISYTAF